MPVNCTHPDYDAALPVWSRARDVVAGEDAIKYRGERYLPQLVDQSPDEYASYKARGRFFNATARTADGFLGLIFRREPTVKLPDRNSGVGGSLRVFSEDVDLMGTSLQTYCKAVTAEVIAVGRCGTLIDWGGSATCVLGSGAGSTGNLSDLGRGARSTGGCGGFVLLDRNIHETAPATLDQVKVVLMIVDGSVAYEAEPVAAKKR